MLSLRETLSMSVTSVASHKIRSMLTILGVVFGVGAVMAMLSIGEGAKQQTLEQISIMGLHNIIIRAQSAEDDADASASGTEKKTTNSLGLTTKDADAIAAECAFAEAVEANAEHKKTAFHGGEHAELPVLGVTPAYGNIFHTELREGRFISATDVKGIAMYCVLGYGAKQKLFAFKPALGQPVKLGDSWFTVIGVIKEKSQVAKLTGGATVDQNMQVFVPVTTSEIVFGREKDRKNDGSVFIMNGQRFGAKETAAPPIDQITVKLNENADAIGAATIIDRILTRRHNSARDFAITVPEELLRQSQATQRIFNIVMMAIASISLLVGGIGIMNIMLASVLERTREIGIRRALGATQRVVVTQFLSEAVILSMSGGVLGLILGFAMTRMISAYADWRTIITPLSIIVAFTVSVATGIAFGYYPARQAARKDPIDALRYE
jgi:putative ABC transport system permease protein